VATFGAPANVLWPADYKSTIRQIENLRYVTAFASRLTKLEGCRS
jgi:hypothetical protein